jgi:[NiFe] hydrogenase assembly HybE family chaperone
MPDARDIANSLEATFRRIQNERMDGVPILNSRLLVEATGTREWNGHWLSVLITPWFINLMLLPQSPEQTETWSALPSGTKVLQRFPAGRFDFLTGEETDIGPYLMCSLFSPVLEFEDHEAARVAAAAALDALFDASLDPATAKDEATKPADPTVDASKIAPSSEAPANPSRRGFLSGRIAAEEGSTG